jgi:hypothetical protein
MYNSKRIEGNNNGMMKEVTDGGGMEWDMENYSSERVGVVIYIEKRGWII